MFDENPDDSFVLDAQEWSDEEWQERPRCDWNYRPTTQYLGKDDEGKRIIKHLAGFECLNEPRWQINTTYSNATKTTFRFCDAHGLRDHVSAYKWTMIDHNTKAYTQIIDLTTDIVCICCRSDDDGGAEECDAITRYQASLPQLERHRLEQGAKKAWEY